jgi:anti-anti-sigma regulatory factor
MDPAWGAHVLVTRADPAQVAIVLGGEIDLAAVPDLDQVLALVRTCVPARAGTPVCVDLCTTTYVGLPAVSFLVSLADYVDPGQVRLHGVDAAFGRVLEVCGLTDRFAVAGR